MKFKTHVCDSPYLSQKELDAMEKAFAKYGSKSQKENDNKDIKEHKKMKKVIRLTESDLHRIVKNSIKRILKESGDSERGSYMYGRAAKRALINQDNVSKFLDMRDKASHEDAFENGMDIETKYGGDYKNPLSRNNVPIKFNYDVHQMKDMDKLGNKFIDFIEQYNGGVLLQTIVDYESGNQTGKQESPLGELIPYFEEEVLGYECTPEMKKAIERAYYHWWYYASNELMPEYDE